MIISASYKTDIPAFYSQWFLARLNAGFCKMTNPYNGAMRRVSLLPKDVDGIVLWTKNIGPIIQSLQLVSEMGHHFIVQYTITGYPRELELAVINADRSIDHVKSLANRWGPRCVVWRYDPILITSLTPEAWHVSNFFFGSLVNYLGWSMKVVVSFAHFYRKTLTNIRSSAASSGFEFYDPEQSRRLPLIEKLAEIAQGAGILLTVCSQPDLVLPNAKSARCVDAKRISDVRGGAVRSQIRGNRPGCECAHSVDVGEYDTCPHGCVYCYAVRHRDIAKQRYHNHDPESEFLFRSGPVEFVTRVGKDQLSLFDLE